MPSGEPRRRTPRTGIYTERRASNQRGPQWQAGDQETYEITGKPPFRYSEQERKRDERRRELRALAARALGDWDASVEAALAAVTPGERRWLMEGLMDEVRVRKERLLTERLAGERELRRAADRLRERQSRLDEREGAISPLEMQLEKRAAELDGRARQLDRHQRHLIEREGRLRHAESLQDWEEQVRLACAVRDQALEQRDDAQRSLGKARAALNKSKQAREQNATRLSITKQVAKEAIELAARHVMSPRERKERVQSLRRRLPD